MKTARPISIIYQDQDIVAINKPAGMLIHRNERKTSATIPILQTVRDQIGKRLFPVHRLDRPTSGIMVFALNREMAYSMARLFAQNKVKKHYLAIVRGIIEPSGSIDYPLTKDPLVGRNEGPLVAARTNYQCLATIELPVVVCRYPTSRYSMALIFPVTGRMHQIRRHFHHISHPIVGDTTYGDGRHNRFFWHNYNCARLLLSAIQLNFPHPRTAVPMELIAPLASDFNSILLQIGWVDKLPKEWR